MPVHTMKFGGTSVGSYEALSNVLDIIQQALNAGDQVVAVVSAMSGVTNALIESLELATAGDKWGYLSMSQKLRDRHEDTINQLLKPGAERETTLLAANKLLDQHVDICDAVNILGEASPRIVDSVVSFGERLSSRMIAAALRGRGINAKAFDAGQFLRTDDTYQNAQPLWDETRQRIENELIPLVESGITPVITGFIGAAPDGSITTLGRGGSDYSAAIFAAHVKSDEFTIWTDVDGVMTTDPRLDPRAAVLPHVSYQEVGEMAFYGAKVLHPMTVQPILDMGLPVKVRNTFNPTAPGTTIAHESQASTTVIKAITSVRDVSMITVSGRGMLGVPGIAGRIFLAAAQAGGNILMISQSSSEQNVCFTVTDDKAAEVKAAIEQELAVEISRRAVESIDVRPDVIILTVVGSGMRGTPGVAGRVFSTIGNNTINVLAIAQGSSECSISFVVGEHDLQHAVVKLHDLALETVEREI